MWFQADCRHLAVRPLLLTRDDPPVVHTNCPTPHIHKGYISHHLHRCIKENEVPVGHSQP